MAHFHFATDAVAERDRLPMFCEEVARRVAALDARPRGEPMAFRASLDMHVAGSVGIADVAVTPSDFVRSAELVRDGDDALCVTLCRLGGGYQTQRGEPRMVAAGEAVVCDSAYIGSIHVTSSSKLWSLKIPRPRIAGAFPQIGTFGGIKLDRDPIALKLLFGYLDALDELGFEGEGNTVGRCGEHIVDLVMLALGVEGDAGDLAAARGGRAARREAVLRHIDRHAANPALSAAAIAGRLGVTPRYVRMLLEETGRSFSEHLLERRLERAMALLANAAERERRIADIAVACGFNDLSYFNRAFRRRYGATPSDVRAAARDGAGRNH